MCTYVLTAILLASSPSHSQAFILHTEKLRVARDKIKLPYSGKLSREKTFANFVDLSPLAKVFFANIACTRNPYSVYSINPQNLRTRRFRESFLPRKFPATRYISQLEDIVHVYVCNCVMLLSGFSVCSASSKSTVLFLLLSSW